MPTADCSALFSADYLTARQRFREAATNAQWRQSACPVGLRGPQHEELTIDIAVSPATAGSQDRTLLITSGLHGVEGLFGSAVQLALLQDWYRQPDPDRKVRIVLVHALNPFGFAWRRRCDQDNVDPNRNFLLDDETYAGAAPLYAQLNGFLNPQRPASRWEPFLLKALAIIARFGLRQLKQAIACGQYAYPQGLFFGGSAPSATFQHVRQHIREWLADSRDVVHLDFHTGLGRYGTGKLLIDYPLTAAQTQRLSSWYGRDAFEACDVGSTAYDARGGFGRWCVAQQLAERYLFACAEYGTFHPVRVLAGLRAENQATHWAAASAPVLQQARQHLQELFCPSDPVWRRRVLQHARLLLQTTLQQLAGA